MKRILAAVLLLALLCMSCCAETEDNALCHAEALIALSCEKAAPEYLKMYISYETESIAKPFQGSRAQPKAIYYLSMPTDAFVAYAKTLVRIFSDEYSMSDALWEATLRNTFVALPSIMGGQLGTNILAGMSASASDAAFLCPEVVENRIYFYLYEDACPAVICMIPYENGVVYANCYLLPDEDLAAVEKLTDMYAYVGSKLLLLGCTIEELYRDEQAENVWTASTEPTGGVQERTEQPTAQPAVSPKPIVKSRKKK